MGLVAEARIAAKFGYAVRTGGGTAAGAGVAAAQLLADGATGLISFGLAGGLDPALRPGTIILPSVVLSDGEPLQADSKLADLLGGFTDHVMLAGSWVVSDATEKRRLHETTRAHAVDLESGAVARVAQAYKRPFVIVRAVCDPAGRSLPPAALVAMDTDGKIGLKPVLRSVLRQPGQISSLLTVAWDAARARRALVKFVERYPAKTGAV